MSPPSTVGRHPLSTRFTARVRVAALSYPDRDSLQSVYTQIIQRVGRCVDVQIARGARLPAAMPCG